MSELDVVGVLDSLIGDAAKLIGLLALVSFVPLLVIVVSFPLPAAGSVTAPAAAVVDDGSAATLAETVRIARSRKGLPYIWGAAGPYAFDCSGLVRWVYAQMGLEAPRTAQEQFDWTVRIDPSQLQPGDLAFYQHTYSSPDRITHVGIYVGGGTVVMATQSGDFVREVSLADPYWRAHFAGAGRPSI